MAATIDIPVDGGSLTASAAFPSAAPGPGIIVLHEIFGVTDFIKSRVNFFGERGFAAIAPDLYWRIDPGASYDYAADWDKAMATRSSLDDDQAVADVGACAAALRARPECSGEIAVVGYCLGGLLAYLAAAQLDLDAAVSYHGVRIESRLEEAAKVGTPLLFHFCGRDKYVPREAVAQIKEALAGHPRVEFFDYPDADHGFTREGQPVFQADAAALAHERTFDFLDGVFAAAV